LSVTRKTEKNAGRGSDKLKLADGGVTIDTDRFIEAIAMPGRGVWRCLRG
jgi:hypothetical protein